MDRLYLSLVAMKAAWGPPNIRGTPKRCDDPIATSAPSSPTGVSSVDASRSVATATRAPASWHCAMIGAMSRIRPDDPGYCNKAPKILEGSRAVSGSPTVT